jgi:hypothetical protein
MGPRERGAATAAAFMVLFGCAAGAPGALAQEGHGRLGGVGLAALPPAERAERRFPQPVRVGDLADQQVLEDTAQQTVLGRVRGVVREGGGALRVLVDLGGLLGFGARRVAVPIEAVALSANTWSLSTSTAPRSRRCPPGPGGAPALAPNETVRIALTKN